MNWSISQASENGSVSYAPIVHVAFGSEAHSGVLDVTMEFTGSASTRCSTNDHGSVDQCSVCRHRFIRNRLLTTQRASSYAYAVVSPSAGGQTHIVTWRFSGDVTRSRLRHLVEDRVDRLQLEAITATSSGR